MEYELPKTTSHYNRYEDGSDPQSPYRLAMIAIGLSVVILAVGLFVFASNTENREDFHGWYLLAYFVFTGGFGVAFGAKKFLPAILCAVMLVGVIGVSMVKFDHRAKLAAFANAPGNGSLLGDYVDRLPAWEYDVLSIGDEPKWAKFDAECYRPIMAQGAENIPETCKTKEAVQTTYNINLLTVINSRYTLMRTTAQQINDKTLADKASYEACVAGQSCAVVPMLPLDANVADLTHESLEYRQIRNAFWQLIDNEQMDASLCEFISLCKAMFDAGAIKRTDFESVKNTGADMAPTESTVRSLSTQAPVSDETTTP
jgi:uncharacterized membrane protein